MRSLSSRAEITATSFTNTYNYGDFRGNPAKLMERYFDAFVYVANWGTHQLMFRIPKRFLDTETASAYCDGESLSLKAGKDYVVLEFLSQDESDGDWTEGEPWMPDLVPLRDELIRGDLRALYLGWLASAPTLAIEDEEESEEEQRLEPPVPPGLAKLSGPLKSLAVFLKIDKELIEAAAEKSEGEAPVEPSSHEVAQWAKGLPVAEKDTYLLRLLAPGGDPHLRMELMRKFRESIAPKKGKAPASTGDGRRSARQLVERRDAFAKENARKAAEKAAAEKVVRDRERASARSKHLDDLARRELAAWREVETLIGTRLPASYKQAVELLVDLRELAERSGNVGKADLQIGEIRRNHARKPSLTALFDKHKLK